MWRMPPADNLQELSAADNLQELSAISRITPRVGVKF